MEFLWFGFWLFAIAIIFVLYWIPTIIAFRRDHTYKMVILGLNFFGFAMGITWLIAVVWAAWPDNQSLADPIFGNPTGKGLRNVGDTAGSVVYGSGRGFADEQRRTQQFAGRP